ncbi:MAG: hypothetical protein AB7F28_00375 [Candidatus Margulisiibacteriota bacterium]
MTYSFWGKFFRKDLKLSDRWWHRLLSVSFLIFVVWFFFYLAPRPETRWIQAEKFSNRITSDIKPIESLLKQNERLGDKNEELYGNDSSMDAYSKDTYYSNNLQATYKQIMIERNIHNLYIYDHNSAPDRIEVTSEKFLDYIQKNNIKGLAIDSFSFEDGHKLYFLQVPTMEPYQDYFVYKKSLFKTAVGYGGILCMVSGITLIFSALILTAYYKVILYIIFGSRKE